MARRMALSARFRRSVQMKVPYVFFWVRAGDRYPELADDLDYFIALDDEGEGGGGRRGGGGSRRGEVGLVWAGSRTRLFRFHAVDGAGSGLQAAAVRPMRDARAG